MCTECGPEGKRFEMKCVRCGRLFAISHGAKAPYMHPKYTPYICIKCRGRRDI